MRTGRALGRWCRAQLVRMLAPLVLVAVLAG